MVESGHGTVGDYISGLWLQVGRLGVWRQCNKADGERRGSE